MSHTLLPPELRTGHPVFDNLHRDLLNAMSDLASVPDSCLNSSYDKFIEKVEHAFAIEEEWMENIEYSSLQNHLEQHARVLGALHTTHPQVMNGDIHLARDVVERLLPQWFMFHMATADMILAAALLEKEQASADAQVTA